MANFEIYTTILKTIIMQYSTYLSKPINVYWLISAIFASILFWRITGFAWDNFVGMPSGDIMWIFAHYQKLIEGKINLFDYIFMRHGDHPHAIVYLLGYLDFIWFSGTLRSLQIAMLVFTVFSYLGLLIVLMQDKKLPSIVKFYLSLIIAAFIFNACALVMWTLPFQVVVASVRVFFIAALALIIFALYTPQPHSYFSLALGLACSWLAAVAHGSGFLIFPVTLLIALSRRRFKVLYLTLAVMLGYFVFALLLQRTQSPLALSHIFKALTQNYLDIFYYSIVYIGSGLVRVPEYTFIAGLVGVIFGGAVLFELAWRAWKIPITLTPLQLFFSAYLLISIGSAFLATTLHLSLAAVVSHHKFNNNYFMVSRYFVNTSAFWFSLIILLSELLFRIITINNDIKVKHKLFGLYRIGFVAVILMVLIMMIWQSEDQISSYTTNNLNSRFQITEAALKSGVFDPKSIDIIFAITKKLYPSFIDFIKKQGLNMFSQTDYPPCGKQIMIHAALLAGTIQRRITISTPTPGPLWGFNDGQRVYGYFSEVTKGNIYIMNETRQLVGYGTLLPNANLLRLTAENFDRDFYLKRYPGVAKNLRYQSIDGAWRHWNEFGKKEGRIALTYDAKGHVPANFIGFVPKSYATHKLTPVLCVSNCIENR